MYGSITDAKRRNEKKSAVGNLGGGGVTGPAALLALFISSVADGGWGLM